jgi:transcription antitermination factor NusG
MPRQLRFKTGDRVKVRPEDSGPFAGLEGTVESSEPNPRDVVVLDRYIVAFHWGEKKAFYDVQLISVSDIS